MNKETITMHGFVVVDDASGQLCVRGMEPTYLEESPKTRGDELGLDVSDIATVEGLLEALNNYSELGEIVLQHAQWRKNSLIRKITQSKHPLGKRAQANRASWNAEVEHTPKSPNDDFGPWLKLIPPREFSRLNQSLSTWLYEEVEEPIDGVHEAFTFFEALPREQLRMLGVSIIEGEFPGSDYFAAELNTTIEEANEAAQKAKLPIRFYY